MPTINYIDLALIVFVVLSIIIGYARGLLVTVINFVRLSFGFGLGFLCSNSLAQPIYDSWFRDRAISFVQTKYIDANGVDETIKQLTDLKKSLSPNAASALNINDFDIPSGKDLAIGIVDNMIEPISVVLIKAIVFILVFLLFMLATRIILGLIKSATSKKPDRFSIRSVSRKVNRLLGALFGLFKAFVVVFGVITLLTATADFIDTKSEFYNMITTSWVLSNFDSINPFNFLTEV